MDTLSANLAVYQQAKSSPVQRIHHMDYLYVPDDTYRFHLGTRHVDVRIDEDHLEVHADLKLGIWPRAGNAIYLYAETR